MAVLVMAVLGSAGESAYIKLTSFTFENRDRLS